MVFDILFTYGSQIINLSHNILAIGRFRIPGRPRKSACFCAKARLLWVTSHQEDKQTWENCSWVAEKKENLKRWKVLEVSKLTCRLDKSLFQTAKGKSARHHQEKQRAWPEIDRNSGRQNCVTLEFLFSFHEIYQKVISILYSLTTLEQARLRG